MRSPHGTTTRALAVAAALGLGLAGTTLFAGDDEKAHQHEVEVHTDRGGDRPWLGVYLVGGSEFRGPGIKIMSVIKDSPAERAGFEDGDVILFLNGVEIEDDDDFYSQFRKLRPKDEVDVVVLRGGDEKEILVTLGERKRGHRMIIPKIKEITKLRYSGPRGYMGVHLQEMTDDLREYFDVPEGEGVLVSQVEEDSPAFDAGFKAGDVITEADGEVIESHGDLIQVLSDKEEGDAVDITYYRDGRRDTVTVNVTTSEENVFDVNTMIWCGDEDEDCSQSFSSGKGFSFSFDNEAFQDSMHKLQEYFGSDEFLNQMKDSERHHMMMEKDLQKKIEELERKLQELEERLQELGEEEEA